MGNALKVFMFALVVVGVYTYYANSIPQIKRQPPEEIALSGGQLSPGELAKRGEQIFYGKGTCAVCHEIGKPGQRAPDLQGIGARASQRRPGVSAQGYLMESLVNPGGFLVEGYGNIMPAINKPPISLNPSEIIAVVAFLQSLGGEVTVSLGDLPSAGAQEVGPTKMPTIEGNAKAGEAIFTAKGCIACHQVSRAGGILGPDLSTIGARASVAYLEESILNPSSQLVSGFPPNLMPGDYAAKLTVKELNDLLAYLVSLKGGPR